MATVGAVVPARNAAATLSGCLRALAASDVVPDEIVCVDDASSDGTWPLLQEAQRQYPRLRPLRLPARRGPAAARNLGTDATQGTWLFFTDSDCTVEPATLGLLLRAAERSPDAAAVVGLYRPETSSGGLRSSFVAAYSAFTHSHGAAASLSTQCALIRRDALVACGGFDESFRSATVEDLHLGHEFQRRGLDIVLEPEARVAHHHVYTWRTFWRNYFVKSRAFMGLLARPRVRWGQGYLHWRPPVAVGCAVGLWLCAAATALRPWALAGLPLLLGAQAALHWRLLRRTARCHGAAGSLAYLGLLEVAMLAVSVGSALGLAGRWRCRAEKG